MSLFGRSKPRQDEPGQAQSADERAIERYRYMLRTAPPETIEQAHAEAFAQLTPEQRRLVLERMADSLPESERASAQRSGGDPQALARMATRAEIRRPGTMERMFGQAGGVSLGGVMAGTLLSSIAGTVLGSMIAREFFAGEGHGAAGVDDASQPGESAGFSDADQAMGDSDSLDSGDFGEV
jgi:hypothetical protein